jgi:outer membrane receptor protein involved in Fe transport
MHAGPDFTGDNYSISVSSNQIQNVRKITPENLYFGALFFEDIWKWSEKTTVFAGARLEDHNLTAPSLSPRIAISHDYSEKTNFKLLYNRGFRTPDWVYYDVDKQRTAAKTPKPETVDSFEGHIIHKFNPKFSFTTIAYYTIYHNLINYWTDSTVSPPVDHGYYNYSTVRAAGLEFTGDYKTDFMKLQVSHSYSKPVNMNDDNFNIVTLSYDTDNWAQFPTNMTKAHAIINLVKDKWLLGVTYFRPWGIKGQRNATDKLKDTADYINATLTYKMNKNFELQLSGYNLTGEDHPWWGASTRDGVSRSIDPHTEYFVRMIWRF